MHSTPILFPVFAMVLLTALVWMRMYYCRLGYIYGQHINPDHYKHRSDHNGEIPAAANAASDNLMNLFEMPVLFYIAAITLQVTQMTDPLFIILCWSYVGLRYVHSFIHITYNRVVHRFATYVASTLVLWIIWMRMALLIW